MKRPIRRIVLVLVAVGTLGDVVADMALASGQADGEAASISGITIPPGCRVAQFSAPDGGAHLLGKVVVVDFCTYTCINWLRTLQRYRNGDRLVEPEVS